MARVMALDFGEVRVGVALSDVGGILASPFTIIRFANREQVITDILGIVREYEVGAIIVGLPYSLNGSVGLQAEKVLSFIEALKAHINVPIATRDERFTTLTAVEYKKKTNKKRSDQKIRYDSIAAAIILQEYLDEMANLQSVHESGKIRNTENSLNEFI